jgi:tetratricopeptide (TPR) repeat protein
MSSEGRRFALIVACDRYADPKLKELKAPSQDAERFARILEDPKIGGFRVTTLINQPHETIATKVNRFLQSCNRDDTVLLYFSCHGIKDTDGELYFATITTDRTLLLSTGIHSNFVNKLLDRCRSQQKVVLLDCCYSGAFEKGRYVRADTQVNPTEYFGKGSVVITASDSMQYAFEGDDKIESLGKGGSYFTNALIEGLESGKADVNNDGKITYSELYNYIHDYVRKITADQTPTLNSRGVEGDFVIFRNSSVNLGLAKDKLAQSESKGATSKVEHHGVRDPILEFVDKARALLEEKKYEDAVKICDTVLMIRPEHLEALNGKGMALYKQKKYKEASECFEKVLKIEPKHSLASDYRELITERISKGHDDVEAKASARDVKQDATLALEKRTEEKVIQALNESTKVPAELIKEGDQFYEKGMYNEAILRYDEAVKIEPSSELAWYGKGLALSKLGRYEETIACYDKVIELNPSYAEAWFEKGWTLSIGLGEHEEAIVCFDKLLEIQPNNHNAWFYKGNALNSLARYEEAIKSYDKALEIKPDDLVAWLDRGLALSKLRKYEEAIKSYDKALEINPEHADAWNNKGVVLRNLGKYQDAIYCYDKALRINPKYADALRNKDLSLDKLREKDDSKDADAWLTKGNALYDSRKYEEAIKCYDKALELNPNYTGASYKKNLALDHLLEKDALRFTAVTATPSKIILWGSNGSGDGQFDKPNDVAVDPSGKYVYVVEYSNNRVQKFDSEGKFITKWKGNFSLPRGIAADPRGGYIYVADTQHNVIQKFDSNGRFIMNLGSGGDLDGQFSYPKGLAIDLNGNLYVADDNNHRIQKFDSNGRFIMTWGSKGKLDGYFDKPNDVAVDLSGKYVYVVEYDNHRVQKFSNNGAFITKWGSKGRREGQFDEPKGIAVDGSGNVYVSDTGNHRIQKFDCYGRFIASLGFKGVGEGQFTRPNGINVDSLGIIYVADDGNHRIQKIGPDRLK